MRAMLFIAPSNFRDEELFHTKEELESAGVECVVASARSGVAKGMLGREAQASDFREFDISDFDALIFVGGTGVEEHKLYENNEVLELAKKAAQSCKVVAAICIAPRILAKAGLLAGKRATCYKDEQTVEMLKHAGASVADSAVEVDGKIVTANGPSAARAFGKRIAELLKA